VRNCSRRIDVDFSLLFQRVARTGAKFLRTAISLSFASKVTFMIDHVDTQLTREVARIIRRNGLEGAASLLGVSDQTLARLIALKRAQTPTINKIRRALARIEGAEIPSRTGDSLDETHSVRSGDPIDSAGRMNA